MSRCAAVVALVVGLASTGAAGSQARSSGDPAFPVGGVITRLAADGKQAAAMTRIKGACGRVVVWTAPAKRSTSFKTPVGCPHQDVPVIPWQVVALALGGGQAAWVTNVGGNETEVTVNAATLTGTKAREIDRLGYDSTSGEGDDAGPLLGGGGVLAYTRSDCAEDSNGKYACTYRLARVTGGRKRLVAGETRPLVAAGAGMLAVRSADGVAVLGADGSELADAPLPKAPTAAALSANRLVVQLAQSLLLFDVRTGRQAQTVRLHTPTALQLAGASTRFALLRHGGRLALVRLADGRSVPLVVNGAVDAKLTDAGMFYAINRAGVGQLVFEATAKLARRF
jgi:hypothetical protein